MAKKLKAAETASPLQDALAAAKISATADLVAMDADYLRCTISGVYDCIQRQGRSDNDLIALAVASYAKHVERKGDAK